MLRDVVPGNPTVFLSGLHTGCYALIGSEKIKSIRDLKGKKVWAGNLRSGPHIFFSAMIAYVGLDPNKDVEYITVPPKEALELFKQGKIDAFMSFPPGPQKLRDQGIGKLLIDTNVDKPWSQYFCCFVTGNREFIKKYPVATKRALRAILKSNAIVARDPEYATRVLIDKGIRKESEYQAIVNSLREIPYAKWNEYTPEDTIRFYMLRLRDVGMTKFRPQEVISQNVDLSFLLSMKDEFGLTWA
jgi:NitT/TauT family transport system substrate-binding protein